jgi:hypothetical protein
MRVVIATLTISSFSLIGKHQDPKPKGEESQW